MRLLLVIDSLVGGGAQRQMVNLATELARRGHAIEVFTYHAIDFFGPQLRRQGIEVFVQPKGWRFSPAPVLSLGKLIRRIDFDAIISFLAVPNLYSVATRRFLRGAPPLVVSHRSSVVGESFAWQDRLAVKSYRWADRVTTNSHHMREFLCRSCPSLEGRISTIWNGVDLQRFSTAPRPQRTEELRLLAMGNPGPKKNWLCLARALAELRDVHGIRATVDFAGRLDRLPASSRQYVEQVNEYLRSQQLDTQWRWLGAQDEVASLFHRHDALVHPSCQEGLPNVACEALASGCPAVLASTLDHPRLIQDGKTGFLFKPDSETDLAGTLARLHQLSDTRRQEMGRRARDFAEQQLSLSILGDRYESLLVEMIAARAS